MIALKLYKTNQDGTTDFLDIYHVETIPPKSKIIKLNGSEYIIKAIVTDEHNIAIVVDNSTRKAFWD